MKTVLIISYYWPPAGGPGVQRILKFIRYMIEYNWHPIILTVRKGEYPGLDPGLEKKIPETCLVYKTNIWEPGNMYKRFVGIKQNESIPEAVLTETKMTWKKIMANWIRLNLFIPDAKIGWKPLAVREGGKIISKYKPDIIFSSSPPPTVHLIAMSLVNKFGTKWIADFRDPWTNIHYYNQLPKYKISQWIDKHIEKKVLKKADKITVVNKDFFDLIDERKQIEITNGFDSTDFPKSGVVRRNGKFTIIYAGSFKTRQYFEYFFDALNEAIFQVNLQNSVKLKFIGYVDPQVKLKIELKNMYCEVNFSGFVGHNEVIGNIVKADLLLLVIGQSEHAHHILSTKVFEYLYTKKPIIAIGPKNSELDRLLQKTKSGKLFEYGDKDNVKHFLKENMTKWKNNNIPTRINEIEVAKYERKALTKKLVNIFEELI